ncbi:MAG: glycosyltransferase family 2 protein [Candidatus Omnitrophica bacterium]|nr:glycosyltransferase family 2 protein [Candidatus Omnitrophota bacterium]
MIKELSIIMPVYNEAESIAQVIRQYYEGIILKRPNIKLIIAEDGSTDGTKDILQELKIEMDFELISGRDRKGYTKAFKDALAYSETEWVFFSDSDGQHDPQDILMMMEESDGFDIVSGCKSPRRDPRHRVFIANVYNTLIRAMFGLNIKDVDSGFKLIRKTVIEDILPQVHLMKYCVMSEFIIRSYLSGYKIKEVPVRHYPRASGNTSIFHLNKLPGIIMGLIGNLRDIKKEYSGIKVK